MIKVKLTGKLIEAKEPVTVGENNTRKQEIIFKEPDSEPDEFTGRIIKGGYWKFDVIGDDVTRLGLTPVDEQRNATVSLFISSDAVGKKDNPDELIYPVNVKLVNINLV